MARSNLERQLADLDRLKQRGTITEDEYQVRRAAILAAPEAATARGGGSRLGGIFKWGFLGCLGMIGAIVLLFVVLAILVAAGSGGDDSEGEPGQAGTNPGDVHVRLAANVTGEIAPERNSDKKSRVTILRIQDNVVSSNSFEQPAAGKKWWGVEVVVENVGTSEVNAISWKLRDTSDGEHNEAFVIGAGERLDPLFNLTPGGKTQGWVFFEIPLSAGPKWLRADPNIFLANDLYFDAD